MSKLNTILKCILVIVCGQLPVVNFAQDIPVGTWRTHISYKSIHTISIGTNKIYAASPNGVMVIDENNSFSTITKLDGLSSIGITQVKVDQSRNQVLVSYSDGNLDIIRANEIFNFDRLKTSTTVSGSKRINHISINGNMAYLSTDYGLVVFDLDQLEVTETWRDLGSNGELIKIYQSTFLNDSVFLATEDGVLAGDLDDNLLDFNNWTRFNTGAFNGTIQSITTFNNKIYAAINGSGIHRYETGTWNLETFLQGLIFKNITAGASNMLVTEGSNLHVVSAANVVTQIPDDKIVNPIIAFEDQAGKFWIGDDRNGLVTNRYGEFDDYVTIIGPSFQRGQRLKYDPVSRKMFAVSGGYSSGFTPLLRSEYLNFFRFGWEPQIYALDQDLTDVEVVSNRVVLSSFGKGIQIMENDNVFFSDELTSPFITALASSSAGIWATNYDASLSLNLLKSDNTWESFSFPTVPEARYPTELAIDYLGHVWMILNPTQGGIVVFDKDGDRIAYLTNVSGFGGLPNKAVYSVATDRDGFVWVGTEEGVAYFSDPSAVFNAGVNAVKPIFENRFLLRDEKITAIEVDGGNRKWIGTENGVWLFDPFGESQVYNFNFHNSPLLSNKIVDIEIDSNTGEVFFLSDAGIVSFRSDATKSDAAFHNVKIFPNPVTAQFNGLVGISGLATDSFVKITDVSGKLIWQTQANGGSASWNVRDYNGRRAASGMYLVFSTKQDGSESVVGKIAVVD